MTTTQKSVTVANNDTAINAEITTQNGDGWLLYQLVLWNDDTNAVLIFTKVSEA